MGVCEERSDEHVLMEGIELYNKSVVGIPDHLHPERIACTNFEIAKVCVKVDLSKPLPKTIDYKINGEDVEVKYMYPWLPNKCNSCGKWGHLEAKCIKEAKVASEKKQESIKKDTPQKNGESGDLEKIGDSSNQKTEIEEGQLVDEWVTPGKTGRSSVQQQQTLKYGEVRIITPSRYSALQKMQK